jgi:hypothetical protein
MQRFLSFGHRTALAATVVALAATLTASFSAGVARAQVFGPPMTLFGSISDAAGPIDAGVPVEAYVGDKLCGKGKTEFVGDGANRVTAYAADVVSKEQTTGCGSIGVEVRVKIGERFATQTAKWQQGPVRLDVTFGNATPAAIPTFTPTPRRDPTADPNQTGTPATSTSAQTAVARTSNANATPTLKGGVESKNLQSGSQASNDGGFPIWAGVLIGLAVLGAAGGTIGFVLARKDRDGDAPSD